MCKFNRHLHDKHRQICATVIWYEMGHGSLIYCRQNGLTIIRNFKDTVNYHDTCFLMSTTVKSNWACCIQISATNFCHVLPYKTAFQSSTSPGDWQTSIDNFFCITQELRIEFCLHYNNLMTSSNFFH